MQLMQTLGKLLAYDAKHRVAEGTSTEDKMFMCSVVSQIQAKRVLEIGVSRGHMTCWLAAGVAGHDGHVTSVDNWSRAHGGEAEDESHALRRVSANGLGKWVSFIKSDSVEFLKAQPDNSFDLVWVDGDHSYEGAYNDITEALRVASQVVAVHDTHQQYTGPMQAVNAHLDEGHSDDGFWIEGQRGIWIVNV